MQAVVVHYVAAMKRHSLFAIGEVRLSDIGSESLFSQVIQSGLGRRKKQRRYMVCGYAVQFLRHTLVVASQSGLHMYHRHSSLHSDQRSGYRRIGVAVNYQRVKVLFGEDAFNARHHLASLIGVRAATDVQIIVRARYAKLIEEYRRHFLVIVLPCVQYALIECVAVLLFYHSRDSNRLYYLRTCAYYG